MTKLLISLFVKNPDNITDAKVRSAYGSLGGAVGIVCNLLLFAGKFFAGIITGLFPLQRMRSIIYQTPRLRSLP